jgi:hypothetical protein
LDAAERVAALAEGFVEDNCSGSGDVEGADATSHRNAQQVIAGTADKIVKASALPAENEDAVAGEVKLVVVGLSAFVETDDPEIVTLELFECTDEIDDAGDAEVLGCSSTGLDGDRAQRGGAALGEQHAVNSCAIGDTQQGAEVLRVFNAVEGQQQAGDAGVRGSEEVFD